MMYSLCSRFIKSLKQYSGFTQNCQLVTVTGSKNINLIKEGDFVCTRDNGIQSIKKIERIQSKPILSFFCSKLNTVTIPKGFFDLMSPTKETTLHQHQQIILAPLIGTNA